MSGGASAHDVAARDRDQQAALGRARRDGRRLAVEHEALQRGRGRARRASAAMRRSASRSSDESRCAPTSRQRSSRPVLVERLLHVERGRRRERVAAEGRGVRARLEAAPHLLVRQHVADRHAAAQPLRQRHDVGHDPLVLEGVERPRAADAGLDLVEDQHRARLRAEAPQLLQETRRRQDDAALGLHGLDDDGARLVGDRAARADASPNGRKRTGSTSGPKPARYFGCPVTASAPIVRPWKLFSNATSSTRSGRARDGLIATGQLQRGLVGLGARVAEEHAALEGAARERLGELQRGSPSRCKTG